MAAVDLSSDIRLIYCCLKIRKNPPFVCKVASKAFFILSVRKTVSCHENMPGNGQSTTYIYSIGIYLYLCIAMSLTKKSNLDYFVS